MSDRALVRNAADRDQVKGAARKVARLERERLNNLRAVMSTVPGRAFLWSLLEDLGIFRSIWDPSSRIHYNAGRQDAGHELMALVLHASPDLYITMEREARDRAKQLEREIDAAQTPRASEGETDNG